MNEAGARSRTLRVLAWAVFGLCVVLWIGAITFGWLSREIESSNASWSGGGFLATALFVIAVLTFPVTGVLIATRRPGNRIGWLLLLIGVGWGLANVSSYSDYVIRLHHPHPGAAALGAIGGTAWIVPIGVMGTFLILLFPDGRLPGPRWRAVAWISGSAIVAGLVLGLATPGPMTDAGYPHTDNPFGIDGLGRVIDDAKILILLVPAMMVASAVSLIVRFRRARGVARQQVKWLAAAAALVAVIYLLVETTSLVVAPEGTNAPTWLLALQGAALVSFGLIPAAIGIAILRHRLFDIDRLVRRTIVYAALVACLALIYLAGVFMLESVVRSVAGGSSTLAVTVSTLAVALAFQPLRRRIQAAVDRRFYRVRYDTSQTLEAFSARMRGEIDLETLTADVVSVVRDALHPAHATVWLRPSNGQR
jgi:hypothetical protein